MLDFYSRSEKLHGVMLHLITWLAIYALVLFALAPAVRSWRETRWFKWIFLPGTLLAVLIQAIAALLCVGRRFELSLWRSGRPAFRMHRENVPWVAGAVFVLLSHLAAYVLFLLAVARVEAIAELECDLVCLPQLHPHDMLDGRFEVEVSGYLAGLQAMRSAVCEHPIAFGVLFWIVAPVLAHLRVATREFLWCALVFGALAIVAYCADWLGMGFPFLTRGWWAEWFYFPRWWALFSLWVTVAMTSCVAFWVARPLVALAKLLALPPGDDGPQRRGKNRARRGKSRGRGG